MKTLIDAWVDAIQKVCTDSGFEVLYGTRDTWRTPSGYRTEYQWLHLYANLDEKAKIQVEMNHAHQTFLLGFYTPNDTGTAEEFKTHELSQVIEKIHEKIKQLKDG